MKGWLEAMQDQRFLLLIYVVKKCKDPGELLVYVIMHSKCYEKKWGFFFVFFLFLPPQTQSRQLEWQPCKNCGKRENESDWTGIEVS